MENREYYVDRHDTVKIEFGLEKINKLLEAIGSPQDRLKVIHIAGTNGKGSVSNYLAYILAYAGFRVGKICSPVVFSKMEFASIYTYAGEICINNADEEEFNKLVDLYKKEIDEIKPSGYEIQIAFSLQYFVDKCDIVIVECGMGGSTDATNVFDKTLCDVITSISLDHVGMIGDTIEQITRCKAGIITKDADVVTTSTNENVFSIIRQECSKKNASLIVASMDDVDDVSFVMNSNSFVYEDSEGKEAYQIRLNGFHQIENAIIAIQVIKVLNKKKYKISLESIKKGLSMTRQRARFDKVSDSPFIIADGAHNEDGARCLVNGIDNYFDVDNYRIIYIISIFKDKNYKAIIEQLLKNAGEIWAFGTDNIRSLDSKILYKGIVDANAGNNVIIKDVGHISNVINEIKEYELGSKLDRKKNIFVCAGSLSFMKDIYGRMI